METYSPAMNRKVLKSSNEGLRPMQVYYVSKPKPKPESVPVNASGLRTTTHKQLT